MLSALRSGAKRFLIDRQHRRNQARRIAWGQEEGVRPEAWSASVSASGHLVIGGCDVVDLARQFGTPLLIVDRSRLEADYRRFHEGFARLYPKVEIGYSYKTNPLPGVIAVLHELGAIAEVISHFELWLALQLGVPPSRILFNGPGKGRNAIELAIGRGVKLINIDSLEEIEVVAAVAHSAGRRQQVGVRVVTSVGWSSQFGLSIQSGDAFEAFRRLKRTQDLIPLGLHVHLGTGIRDVHTYLQAVRELMEFAHSVRSDLGVEISYFDLGGGFGVPTVQPFDTWDYRLMRNGRPPAPVDLNAAPTACDYARGIVEIVRRFYPATGQDQPTLVLEPGRALTSSAQCLVLQVLTVKRGATATPTVILDGGKNIALPTGYECHELLPVTRANQKQERSYNFFGPLCHPGDSLFVEKTFAPVAAGDFVAVMDAGAYFVPNETNFSHTRAPAVLVENGTATLLRARESFADIVMRDRFSTTGRSSSTQDTAPRSAVQRR